MNCPCCCCSRRKHIGPSWSDRSIILFPRECATRMYPHGGCRMIPGSIYGEHAVTITLPQENSQTVPSVWSFGIPCYNVSSVQGQLVRCCGPVVGRKIDSLWSSCQLVLYLLEVSTSYVSFENNTPCSRMIENSHDWSPLGYRLHQVRTVLRSRR